MEARAKVSWQKAAEAEEIHLEDEGAVIGLRGSLGLLETMRDAAHSELHGTQLLVAGVLSSPFFPSPPRWVSFSKLP